MLAAGALLQERGLRCGRRRVRPVLRRGADRRGGARPPCARRRRGRPARHACDRLGNGRRARAGGRRCADRGERAGDPLRARGDRHGDDPQRAPEPSPCRRWARRSSTSTPGRRARRRPRGWREALLPATSLEQANDLLHDLGVQHRARLRTRPSGGIIAPVPWVETASLSFTARHEASHAEDAEEVLEALEEHRNVLEALFPRIPGNVTVVLHDSAVQLGLSQPYLPVARRLASPPARRYMAGWFAAGEVHVLAPAGAAPRRGGPGLARRAEAHAPARLHAARRRREQPRAAASLPPRQRLAPAAQRLAGRGSGPALLGPGSLPAPGDRHPAAPRPRRLPAARRATPASWPARCSTCLERERGPQACVRARAPYALARLRARRSKEAFEQPAKRSSAASAPTWSGSAAPAPATGSLSAAASPWQPDEQRHDAEREQHAREQHAGRRRAGARSGRCRDQLALHQHLTRRLDARLGHQDVARAGREHVGHVEARGAAQRCSGCPLPAAASG